MQDRIRREERGFAILEKYKMVHIVCEVEFPVLDCSSRSIDDKIVEVNRGGVERD